MGKIKILYSSSHSILEFDELSLLTELDTILPETEKLNIEVFSIGAYSNPLQSGDFKRGVIPKGRFYPELYSLAMQSNHDAIHPELVDWCDIWICMHNSALPGAKHFQSWIVNNFRHFKEKNKKVIWRSIGQSNPSVEAELKSYRNKGMNIVRYSPLEEKIPGFAGSDAMIRFYKDPEEFNGWVGDRLRVLAIVQSFKQRGEHLGFSVFDRVTANFQRIVFGSGNSDLGDINGGEVDYQHLKNDLKENRVFFYYGTQPAPYTLSFVEALTTGIPVVAVGPKLRGDNQSPYNWPNYEIPEIITNGTNGFVSDSIDELIGYIDLLFKDKEVAQRIGDAGRKTAIELFSKEKIMKQWADFLKKI